MFGLNEVPDLSSDGVALKRFITREPPRKEVYGNVVNSNLENILLCSRETSSLQNIGNSLPRKQSSMFHARGPDKKNRPSEDVSPSKFISETLDKENYTEWLKQEDIARIANLQYGWHGEDNNIIFDIIGSLEQLESQLKEYQEGLKRPNKQSLTYIINLDNNHWVTLVITCYNQQFLAYYIDSFGRSIRENYKSLLEGKRIRTESFNVNQQKDVYNCGIFALENAKIINESIQSNEIDNLEKKLQDLGRELSTQQLMDIRQSFANLLKENSENLPSNCQLNDQMSILSSNELEEDHVIRMLVSFLGSNTQEKPSIDDFKIGTVAQDCLLDAIAQGLNELRSEGIIEHSSEFSTELLQQVCVAESGRDSNYEYEEYVKSPDPKMSDKSKVICDKYGVDFCVYSIQDNKIKADITRANIDEGIFFTSMEKDDEDFWIDYSKTIRIVQYNQYFVPFFSKNSRYILEEDHVIRMLVSFLGSNTQEKPSIDDFKIGTVAQDCLLDAIAQGLNELRSEGIIEHSSEFSTELLQQVCVAESGRDSNYEYEEYVKSPDPKMSDKSKVICDKYGVDFCVYSIQDNKIKADITRANIDEGIFFTSMEKDDEDFWIDYSKTIRIVQYNQYFVPFFSKNSRYILEEDHVIRMLVSFLGSNTQEKPSIDDFKIGTVAQDCLLDAIAQGLNELRSEGIIEHSSEFSTELLQQVCVAESGRDSNYEYEEYVKSPDPKMSDKSKVICDKYGVDFCVYSIQDNKIKADITRANIDEGIFFTSMEKDDEDFWIDYSKTIRIVQYNQYFVPFFSKNSRYIEAYDACTSKLAELLLDHPKEFNEKFNDVLKTISSLSSYEEQASKIYSVIDQVLAFFTELCEKVSIRKPGYSKILDDRGEVNIKIELSFVIKEGKEIIRVIDIIQQTEGLFANVSEELLYNEFNNQLDSRLEIRHTIPEIVITTDAYTSGNDDNAEDGAGGILSICNSVSVNSLDQKIMGELMQYKLNRLNIISIVQEESSIFRVKRLEFRRVPTGKEGNHILPVSTFFKCLASFFTMSKDFFEATDDLLSIFSQIKQNHKYSSYIEKSYKTLKEARDKKILCKEKLTVFLECGLIPFVFLAWNERDTSVYSQLKTQRRFGQEGAAVRFVNKKFESLLNDVPSSLESFQERIKEMQGEFFGVLDIPVIVRIDPADQKKLEQYSNDISKYLIRRIDTILNYPGNIIENYLLEQIEISISVSDSDEARKAFGEIQKLSNRKYSKKTYEKISSECTKIKGHLKDQQIREYLDTFEISQKFKCELKKFSSNIVKNVKGYNLLQYLDKVINFYQGEQDEEVIGKLSKLKLNLTIILQTLENFNSEAHHAKTGDINTIARDDLNIIVDSDLNELKSNLTIVLRVLKSLDSEARFKITEEIRNAIDIIAKDDLSAIIYDVRKLFQAWIYILELKKPHYLQKKEGYVQFLNSFFNKQHFLQELINNKIRIQDRLDKLRKIILQETDNQSELSFDYGTQASVTGRPGSYTKGIQDIQDIQDIQGTDDINNAYSIIKNNLKEGYDIYNESFIRIILEYSTYREFRVFIGTAGEEEILKTKATIKHETQNNTSDYLLIIKNEKNNFIKYVINGEEPKCLSINSNDDFIKAVIYTIKQDYGINLSPIAMIESVDHPIPPHRNIAMVQMHSPNYGQLHYSIAKHYLKYHRKIEISGESHQSCKRGCNSMLKEPFQDLYNKYLSRSINKKLVVKNAASDNHQFRLDQQAANKLVLDGNEKVTHTINEEIIDSKSVNKRSRISDGSTQKPLEKKASLDDPTRQNVDVEKSTGDHQKEDASYKQQNLSRKGSLDDGNNSKKQERGFKSTSDLPGNSNDCGSKGSSLHNSEKVLEEDLLLSPSNSNDGNDLHDSAQGFNEGLLLSPGDSDNESDLHHQAQNFNNESASGINFPVMIVPHVSSTPDAQVDSDDKSYDNLPGQNVEPEFISQNDEEKRNSLSGKEGSSKHGNTSEESTNEDRASSSTKRLRTSDGNTQKPPVKKVAQSDSPRQNVEEVKIEPSVGSNKSYGQQGSGQESSLNNGNNFQKQESDSEYGGTSEKSASRNLNNIQPNSENQEIFPRSPNASESSVEQENDLEQDDTIEERSEQSCNSKQYNSSRKEVINKGENIVNKRPRISDGSTQKPPEKKVTLDDSPSDLPGNNNDCGPKGSSSHNSEQALEEDQLLSFGDSNNGTDSHNLAQDFNKDLLLSSGNCDNKSDLYDQAQNFNSDNEGSTLSSPDEKRPCIGDEDTPKLPNVEEVEVESNVGNDKSYERQDSNRESGPEASDSWSKSKHPTLNDVSDESFGDEKSVCSSPEQNSGSSLEQASNSSERNDLQSNGNDSNSSESEKSSASSKSNVGNDESYEQQDSNWRNGSEESDLQSSNLYSHKGSRPTLSDTSEKSSSTSIFAAVKNNNLDLIRKHIKEKVDVNDRNESGYAPLHLAAQNNFADAVMILIKAGAEVDLKAENNFCLSTPLHLAFRHKAMDSAKVLMENKADINAVNARQRKTYQELSFNYAKIIQYEEARSFLLDYKIDLSDSENGDCIERIKLSDEESFNDELGEESSSSHDSHGAIEFHGTNDQDAQSSQQQEPNTRTTSSQQQESSAQVANDSSMPPMFRSRSSDQHLQDVEQNDHIPLHVAAQNGHLNVVEALLGGGTSVDVGSFLKKQHLNALNIEMRLPKTTLNSVALDNHLRRRSASF